MRTLKFRVYIPDIGKFAYFGLDDFDLSDRYLDQKDYPVQQYIGSADIHGIEIYEGDIVKRRGTAYIYVVSYSLEYSGYQVENIDGDHQALAYYRDKLEVIGNIHETPERFQR